MTQKLGFIGMGNMGSRLAANWAADSGGIAVWDRNLNKHAADIPQSAIKCTSIPELVSKSDVIGLSISNDSALQEVIHEIATQNLDNKVIIDFSTVSPDASASAAKLIAEKGGAMLDAAVSGSTPQVETRSLTIFVGGSEEAFDSVRSLIEPLGSAIHYMGTNGAGLKMKLAVNLLLGVGIASLAESLVLAQKLGLDKDTVITALTGTAVLSPSQTAKLTLAQKNTYSPATFSLELMDKDLGLVLEEAQKLAVNLSVAQAAKQKADTGMAAHAAEDFAVMIQTAEREAGLA